MKTEVNSIRLRNINERKQNAPIEKTQVIFFQVAVRTSRIVDFPQRAPRAFFRTSSAIGP